MNLANLKSVCAAYHDVAVADLTKLSIDLFLVAANNIRRNKELLHNFEYSRCVATLDVNGVLGGSIDDAVIAATGATAVTVTGTLSPDATGTYIRTGNFGGYPLFVKEAGTVYFLYYNATLATYILAAVLTTSSVTNAWIPAVDQTTFTGAFVGGGANTGTATIAGGVLARFTKLKEVVAVSRMRPDGTYIPLDFARADIPIERDRTELEFSDNLFPYLRYPSDAQISARGTSSSMIQRGRVVEIYPYYANNADTTFNVRLEAYGLLADYTAGNLSDTGPTDFFVEYGAQFLQWSIINELNYVFKTFVPRTEGNLSAPEQKASDAWRDLLLWDTYMIDANTTRSR